VSDDLVVEAKVKVMDLPLMPSGYYVLLYIPVGLSCASKI